MDAAEAHQLELENRQRDEEILSQDPYFIKWAEEMDRLTRIYRETHEVDDD